MGELESRVAKATSEKPLVEFASEVIGRLKVGQGIYIGQYL
jgi:hypothetical protein